VTVTRYAVLGETVLGVPLITLPSSFNSAGREGATDHFSSAIPPVS